MKPSEFAVAPGLVAEELGTDLILMGGNGTAIKLSGSALSAFRAIEAGNTAGISPEMINHLIGEGLVVRKRGTTRRQLVTAGSIGLASGLAVLAMPGVAAASSIVGGCMPGEPVDNATYGNLDGGNRLFWVNFNTPGGFDSNTSEISDLTVFIGGQTFTGELENVLDQFGEVRLDWDVFGAGNFTGTVCGNFTVDGVRYRADFGPNSDG